jgi:hypothetical protein
VRKVTKADIVGLKVDETVQITYRIGKSGRVYVDHLGAQPTPIPSALRR